MISVLLVSMALVAAVNPALAELNAADVAAWTAFYEAANGGGTDFTNTASGTSNWIRKGTKYVRKCIDDPCNENIPFPKCQRIVKCDSAKERIVKITFQTGGKWQNVQGDISNVDFSHLASDNSFTLDLSNTNLTGCVRGVDCSSEGINCGHLDNCFGEDEHAHVAHSGEFYLRMFAEECNGLPDKDSRVTIISA